MNVDDPRHGTINGYINLGCRCSMCRDANRIRHAHYINRLRAGDARRTRSESAPPALRAVGTGRTGGHPMAYGLRNRFTVHSTLAAQYISAYATEAQKQRWIPKMASGRWCSLLP